MSDRQMLAQRLNEAGLLDNRFIPVRDGAKASLVNHHEPENRHSSFANVSGNYGVYAGAAPDNSRHLIVVDKDEETDGLDAANALPDTLSTESPHTDGADLGHDYYLIVGENVAERLKDAIGVYNPVPEWGEVRVRNQYVVGPGSELDSCDKDWHDCSQDGEGHYRISKDAPIAEIELNDLVDVLKASGYDETDTTQDTPESVETDSDGYEEAKEVARNDSKIVTYLTEGAGVEFDGDRSDADFYVACRMVENYVPEAEARQLLESGLREGDSPDTKVRERGDNYWQQTWQKARQKVSQESDSRNSGSSGSDSTTTPEIEVDGGSTFYVRDGERQQVLNFALDVDSILKVDNREVIQANLNRPNGQTDSIQFEPRDMQKKQRFKDNVLSDKIGLTFTPPGRESETVLNALNEYIGQLDVPEREGTHHIGLHGGEWVTPDGSLGSDGWIDEPGYTYITRNVALERAVSLPTDTAEYDEPDVKEILKALPETRETARMLAVLGWFYAAPLRPYIFDEWNAGAFNHLNITGDTGSGKTTTLRYLWRCFGVESDPFAVTDTKFAMLSALAASNGVPVWYDEYKPSEIQDYRLDQFHDLYRKAATGGTATRGRADQTTEEYHTHAPVVVSGEEQIRRPAERRRSIMVAFKEDVTGKGTETRKAFKSLVGEGRIEDGELVLPADAPDPTNHAVAYYRWLTGADATTLRAKWQDAREIVWQKRREWDTEYDLDDMEVQGLRTVTFGWLVMRAFAEDQGVSTAELPGRDALDAALRHIAGEIGPSGQRKSHMDRFVELLERATGAGYVEKGQHYELVHEGQPGSEELRIHLPTAYDALSRYARDHGLDSEELLSNADDYRKRLKEAAESNESYVITGSQVTAPINKRCAGISTIQAMNQLEFDRATFTDEHIEAGGPDPTAEGAEKATTDGGSQDAEEMPPADADGPKADARRLAQVFRREGVTTQETAVSDARAAGKAPKGMSPEAVTEALEKGHEELGLFAKTGDGDYYLLD